MGEGDKLKEGIEGNSQNLESETLVNDENLIYRHKNHEVYMYTELPEEMKTGIIKGQKSKDFKQVNDWNQPATATENPKQTIFQEEIIQQLQIIIKRLEQIEKRLMQE